MSSSIIHTIAYIILIFTFLASLIASIITYKIGQKTKKKSVVLKIYIAICLLSVVATIALWKTENIALMKSQREIKNKTNWVEKLSKFKDITVVIQNIDDVEAKRFAADIRGMFYSAKWKIVDQPPEIELTYLDGVFVAWQGGAYIGMDKITESTNILLECFKESGVKAVGSLGGDPNTIIIKIAYNPIIPRKGFHMLLINPRQMDDTTAKKIIDSLKYEFKKRENR